MNNCLSAGVDDLIGKFAQKGNRVGLVTNEAALTAAGVPSRKALLEAGYPLTRLFSPEHGLNVAHADGARVEDEADWLTGLPVVSLYGSRLKPSPENLKDLDALLFDIPDVGCRFYTYLWTLTHAMEACCETGTPLIVLDRPNPIGGNMLQCEGPLLNEQYCSSFIGRWSIPIRHGCTLGEMALYFKATRLPALNLTVVPCNGWNRDYSFFETHHPFTPTSPAIRNAETALLYPGTGLLEGIHVNEGRGTAFPFKQAGAPWIDAGAWKEALEKTSPEGVKLETVGYLPEAGLYSNELCNGLRFTVTDAALFRPVNFGIQLIVQLMKTHPGHVKERLYPTVANPGGHNHLDRLLGIKDSFSLLQAGHCPSTGITEVWTKTISPYLLY